MRVGYFGGTFDPPHFGHLAVARAAAKQFSLDQVLMAPTGRQPLKSNAPASFSDRVAMMNILCQGEPDLEVTLVDAPASNGEPNYTVNTITNLRALLGEGVHLFSIIGIDAFLDFHRWRSPERLLELAEWVVVSRPGFSLEAVKTLALTAEQCQRVHELDDVAVPVSATEIRARLREGRDVRELLPESELEYIRSHDLYEQ